MDLWKTTFLYNLAVFRFCCIIFPGAVYVYKLNMHITSIKPYIKIIQQNTAYTVSIQRTSYVLCTDDCRGAHQYHQCREAGQ